ncbi:hypothetical protein K3495_g11702 [Podosphaera aphanis]|nr:hypothetical protein K3495_g11702 [Podosphaera aphanis]
MDPSPITVLSPPPAGSYASFEAFHESIQGHAKAARYATTIVSSSKRKGRTLKILICKKSGYYRSEVNEPCRVRQRLTRKTNSPFRFKARDRTDNTWGICFLQAEDGSISSESISHDHKHSDPSSFPEHPRLDQEEMALVRNDFSMCILASRTVATLKNRELAPEVNYRDIHNINAQISRSSQHGPSTPQAFINCLTEQRHFNYLFVADTRSTELVNESPDILLMDCTYKTIKLGMPLLDILGLDNLNSSFTIGFCFLDRENEQDYDKAVTHLQFLYQHSRRPSVIATDRKLALMNAIDRHFPYSETSRIIYFWHICKSLMVNCKARFETEERWKEFERFFSDVVHSMTPEEYLDRVEEFKTEINYNKGELHELPLANSPGDLYRHVTKPLEQDAVRYALRQWLETRHMIIVHAWNNQFFNRNTTTTSRLECEHDVPKR